jgi:hypothetical protein
MRRVTVAVAAVLAVGSVGVPLEAAAAGPVRCGDRITVDTRLTADLRCAGGPGLVLAGGVTLDLGGHRLVGPGSGTGVLVTDPVEATLRNGQVVGWGTGVDVRQADDSLDTARLAVRAVVFRSNRTALSGFISQTRIADSVFGTNTTAVDLFYAGATIDRSAFLDNRSATSVSQTGPLRIADSTFLGNDYGVDCTDTLCTVDRSRMWGGNTALYSFRANIRLTASEVRGYKVGFRPGFAAGRVPDADAATGSRFVDNDIAVQLGSFGSMTLTGNLFTGNRVAVGELADSEIEDALLADNRFERNGDAVNLPTLPVAMRHNTAVRNTGWGLYAPRATDLGGNTASRNGKQPPCTGVVCTIGS